MSTIVGNIVIQAKAIDDTVPSYVIASALAVIAGGIVCGIGLIRWGWIVELISLSAVSAFLTGSAINIAVGQVPTLLANASTGQTTWFNTRDSTYMVIINTLKYLPKTKLDAALGLTSLFLLYLIRFVFNYLAKKQPQRKKLYFFCNTLRSVFVILLYTLIGWLVNLHLPNHDSSKSPFKILGTVPRGFTHAAVPTVNRKVISLFANQIPVTVIVLLIEHIAIAKSFGRVNNYTINPSQELVAIGVTNLLAPFLGGYPATGSFSRTAIKSKAGVRTPLAGVITAIVVLLAIYALPAVFFYIPNAALAGVIIHAVGDLITPPNTVYQFWKISPLEVIVFFAGVFVTIFTSIENGIYVTVGLSGGIAIWRFFHVKGEFLGRIKVYSVIGDHVTEDHDAKNDAVARTKPANDPAKSIRNVFVPLNHHDGSNPNVKVEHPYPGIFIYRTSENLLYINASTYLDGMVTQIFKHTRRTNPHSYGKQGDRPWNDPGPRRGQAIPIGDNKPTLKAVILDFSTVNNIDLTTVQTLIDIRNQLDRYAAPHSVQWHFAGISNRWTKRALAAAGFGYPTPEPEDGFHRWKPIFSVADIGGSHSAAAAAEAEENRRRSGKDIETGKSREMTAESASENSLDRELTVSSAYNGKTAPVSGLNRPLFHLDLTGALESAISNAERLGLDAAHDHIALEEDLKPDNVDKTA